MLNDAARQMNSNIIAPSAIIETPADMNKEQFLKMMENFQWHKKDKGRPAIISGGKWVQNAAPVTAESAQFIETLNYRTKQIANLFGVPAYKLNITSDRKPNTSVVQENADFYNSTIKPIVDAFSSAMNHRLLTENEQEEYIIEFDTSELADEGMLEMDNNVKAIVNGIKTRAEVRKELGYPYKQGSDELLIPQNQAMPESKL